MLHSLPLVPSIHEAETSSLDTAVAKAWPSPMVVLHLKPKTAIAVSFNTLEDRRRVNTHRAARATKMTYNAEAALAVAVAAAATQPTGRPRLEISKAIGDSKLHLSRPFRNNTIKTSVASAPAKTPALPHFNLDIALATPWATLSVPLVASSSPTNHS